MTNTLNGYGVNDHLIAATAKHSDSFIIISDKTDAIIWVNDSMLRKTGYTLSELQGKKAADVFRGPKTNSHLVQQLDDSSRKGDRFTCEILNYTKCNEPFWIQLTVNPVKDESGEVEFFISIGTEISDLKQVQQELVEANKKAEKLDKERKEIFSALSHDLKSPLSSITGVLSLFEMEDLSDTQKEYVKLIKASSQNMSVLIDNILELGKYSSDKVRVNAQKSNLREIAERVIDQFEILAQTSNNTLHLEFHPELNGFYRFDPLQLSRVLSNLTGNAIKFTRNGTVRISFTKMPNEEESSHMHKVLIKVSDTGCGIPAESQKKIFSKFEQSDDSIISEYGGTGLGLSICKRIVHEMGGSIRVESELHAGTTFFVEVELEQAGG